MSAARVGRRLVVVGVVGVLLLTAGCGTATTPPSTPRPAGDTPTVVDPTAGAVPPLHPAVDGYPEATLALQPPGGHPLVPVAVKVAHTAAHRQRGLKEVDSVPRGVGMLFLFADQQTTGFWMKDTGVALDIAWAGTGGDLLDIQRMSPCSSAPCPVYRPDEPYRVALEVAAGWLGEVGVDESWRLVLPAGLPPAG